MTRAKMYALLKEAIPKIQRMARADSTADAVIYREELSPRIDNRTMDLVVSVVVPVERALNDLDDDPRVIALREMCQGNGLAYNQVLAPDETWGCPVYTCTITNQRVTG